MKRISIIFIIVAIALGITSQMHEASAQGTSIRYIYKVFELGQRIRLVAVDPTNPTTASPFVNFLLTGNERIERYGKISPDGRWLPAYYSDSAALSGDPELGVRIFNMDGSAVNILWGVYGNFHFDRSPMSGLPEFMQWSPDSRYLAILARPKGIKWDNNDTQGWDNNDIYVYDRQTGNTYNVTNDPHSQGQYSWSPDSRKLVYTTVRCVAGDCQTQIDVFDVSTLKHTHSAPLGLGDIDRPENIVCLFAWAPDSSKLVFRVNCADPMIPYQELHILDLVTGIQSRFTNYTAIGFYSADQYPVWYDSDLLLIGGYIGLTIIESETIEEIGFIESDRISTNTRTVLSEDGYVSEWAASGKPGQYVVSERIPGSQGYRNPTLRTRLVNFVDGHLQVVRELPTGCDFSWDATRRFLIYALRSDPFDCGWFQFTRKHVFYDAATDKIAFLPEAVSAELSPLGWSNTDSLQPAPTPTK